MAMTADSSYGDDTPKYDVFLSFSGVDTRKGFTSTLFHFLKSKGIVTFIDDPLPRGQQIETSLVKTIEESKFAVVVFSKNYASSSSCLDELVKIREFKLVIMPIFYDVKPDDVLELSGEFGKEFAKLKSTENEAKIKKWRNDLAFAATISGWDLNNYSTEIDLIEEVTDHILNCLDPDFDSYSSERNKTKAISMAMAADSSSGVVTKKYDVFLSFKGADTRKRFTDTLFNFLKNKGIKTFIDDGLPRGQQIETSLDKTILESKIAVVVFSKNYASSSWCLDELAKIREFNLKIMPIYDYVKPDHVLELSGEFGKEFAKLKSTEKEVKIKKWSNVLTFAAKQSGWDLNNYSKEIDVINEVAACILKYLDSVLVSTYSERNKTKATSMAMAADSSSGVVTKYDLFLSFSGVDTSKGFTNTLFDFLKSKGIEAFVDGRLPKGQQIEASIINTIQESKIAVVVFSKKYASSSWCLDELVKMRESNLVIVPIFFYVKPDHVLELSGEFGKEFAKLKSTENEVKIKKWSDDLAFAATQSGWDLNNYSKEINVIKEVTAYVLKYLDSGFVSSCSSEFSHYIGIASLVDDLQTLLTNESFGIQFLGLWGMEGVGKTTIAEVLYRQLLRQLSQQFDDSYFCSITFDVKDVYSLVALRNGIISHIIKETFDEGTPSQPPAPVLSKLQTKKVLIVLDNVSTSNQVTTLVGSKANPWFGSGSKVIVTSRDFKILENKDMMFREIVGMSKDNSLRLFCLHAFKLNQPLDDEDYVRFSNAMVDYTKGYPLALKVLGRDLYGRTKDEWRSTLERLETCMPFEIVKVLMISYNDLNEIEKEIFLDIACFFKGYHKDWVKEILDGCGFKASIGIARLIEKCLVTLNHDNTLGMHDLLQKMGQDIVEEQSSLGMLKRIRRSFDSYNLLANCKEEASKAIEGIFLNTDDHGIEELNIHPMIFSKMQNLRMLIIQDYGHKTKIKIQSSEDFYANGGIQFLPNDLRLLYWNCYPSEFLPSIFSAENLVILDMWHSGLQRLWKEAKNSVNLKNLKVLDVSYSNYLTTLPDLTSATKLEKIILDGCTSLLEIPAFIQHLQSLSILRLAYCEMLCDLPSLVNICTLRKLDLHGCKGLKEFPETSKEIEELILWETSMVQWPDSMSCLNNLKVLELPSKLQKLPCTLHLNSLEELILVNCDVQVLPEIIGCLRKLYLGSTEIRELPSSIVLLSSLIVLDLSNCHLLETLPNNFGQLNCLEELRLSGCEELLKGPMTLSGLNSIKKLYLDDCRASKFPSWVCTLSSLQLLDLSNNDFVSVPNSIRRLSLLKVLNLSGCCYLRSLPKELPWQTTSSDIADIEEPHQFCFADCESLGEGARRNIVEKTMKRIQHVANRQDEVFICPLTVNLPGTEIPEFFEGRYDTWGIVKLPTDLSSSTFRGLVIGVIAYAYCLNVDFKCTLEKADDSYLCSFDGSIFTGGFVDSETLCLHYLPSGVIREYCKDDLKDVTHATFRFQRSYHLVQTVRCGVRLVFANHEV